MSITSPLYWTTTCVTASLLNYKWQANYFTNVRPLKYCFRLNGHKRHNKLKISFINFVSFFLWSTEQFHYVITQNSSLETRKPQKIQQKRVQTISVCCSIDTMRKIFPFSSEFRVRFCIHWKKCWFSFIVKIMYENKECVVSSFSFGFVFLCLRTYRGNLQHQILTVCLHLKCPK